jgi:uncharacterized protein with PIN domain
MTHIINPVPSKTVLKEAVCPHCGVTLGYVPNDIARDYTSDYTGDKDYYNFVVCPACAKQVKI